MDQNLRNLQNMSVFSAITGLEICLPPKESGAALKTATEPKTTIL